MLCYSGCAWLRTGNQACDLNMTDRAYMCEECLSYLLKQERPSGWSPRVKKLDNNKDTK